jgi:hypothetical protein
MALRVAVKCPRLRSSNRIASGGILNGCFWLLRWTATSASVDLLVFLDVTSEYRPEVKC